MNQIRHVDLADRDSHQRLVLALQLQHAFARHFWKLIQDGHVAGEQLQYSGRRVD